MTEYDAVVAAGGAGRRLGGADKPGLTVGGRALLDRVLAACAGAREVLVVGPERPVERAGVRWLREDPPGGGPVAALAAALPEVTAPVLLLLAADLPFLDTATVDRLLAALGDADGGASGGDGTGSGTGGGANDGAHGGRDEGAGGGANDGALLVDAGGREQPLAAAYRTAALRAALAALGDPAGRPLRRLTAGLRLARVPDPAGASFDCDTWAELAAARRRAGED